MSKLKEGSLVSWVCSDGSERALLGGNGRRENCCFQYPFFQSNLGEIVDEGL
jgi:hypothetical protein